MATDTQAAALAPAARRRRLWQLSPQAHELLLATSIEPASLRREAARVLGRLRGGRCVLQGTDADVLDSVLRDLTTRNLVSEALQQRLQARHAPALRQFGALRTREALQAAWAGALDADTVPAALWALLTHPLAEELEAGVLRDARHWLFGHARRSLAMGQQQRQADAQLLQARQAEAALRRRLLEQQQRADEALRAAQAEAVRLRGELARRAAPAAGGDAGPAAAGVGGVDAGPREVPRARTIVPPRPHAAPAPQARPEAPALPARPAPSGVAVGGRRVLCVGGIRHAVARYRGRIEQLGGRFEHHDGGLEESLHALDARLGRADVVICQAACINHEAYHRVKSHCERTGKPCVYLERPSLSHFSRVLAVPDAR